MREKIIISKFLGIKDIEIDLKRFNIIIGPQASGKSVIAKTIYHFKSLIGEIFNAVENQESKRTLDSEYLKKFELCFPQSNWGEDDFLIRYELDDVFIEIKRERKKKSKLKLTYSDYFKQKLGQCRRTYKKHLHKISEEERFAHNEAIIWAKRALWKTIEKEIDPVLNNTQLFIPAGRSFFTNVQSSVFTFLSMNNAIDPFLQHFGSIFESIKRPLIRRPIREKDLKVIKDLVNGLISKILCGTYLNEKGKEFIISHDGRKIKIANTSSGQQEILPLLLILRSKIWSFRSIIGQTIYIEEPEAHLFPTAQKSVVDLISTIFNFNKKIQFFITTHSPYILSSVNNLIQARILKEKLSGKKSNKLDKIIPDYRKLYPNDVNTYSLLGDGTCNSIKCIDNGLIDTNIIDNVSNELAIEFDNLLELE